MRKLLAVLALCLCISAGTAAEDSYYQNGIRLLEGCTSPEDSNYYAYCLGAVAYTRDTHTALVAAEIMEPLTCVPKEVTPMQLARVVVKYLEKNPEELHMPAAAITLVAFKAAFPCEK